MLPEAPRSKNVSQHCLGKCNKAITMEVSQEKQLKCLDHRKDSCLESTLGKTNKKQLKIIWCSGEQVFQHSLIYHFLNPLNLLPVNSRKRKFPLSAQCKN